LTTLAELVSRGKSLGALGRSAMTRDASLRSFVLDRARARRRIAAPRSRAAHTCALGDNIAPVVAHAAAQGGRDWAISGPRRAAFIGVSQVVPGVVAWGNHAALGRGHRRPSWVGHSR